MKLETLQCADAPPEAIFCKQHGGDSGGMTMSPEWRTVKLVDISAKRRWALNGGPFGSKLSRKHYSESGVPVIRGTNLSADSKFSFDDFVYVSEEKADELRANNAHPGDLIFTQRGTIGQVGLIPFDSPISRFVISQSQMKLAVDPEQADALFLYYFFSAADTVQKIQNLAFAAGVPHINLDILRKFETPVPPLSLQRRIAGILSAYDELIENSLRRIRILEEMARSLYREWFVHFRFPGHESHPLEPSSLGDIPQGWEVKPLKSLMVDHIGGGWGKDIADEDHTEPAWVIRGTDIPDARSSRIAGVPHRFHTVSNLRARRLQAGDILFEVSGGSKNQPVGRTLLVTPELLSAFGDESVICASFCKRVRPNVVGYGSELLYLSFLEGYKSGEIEQFQVQSTGISNFKWTEYIAKIERVIPPEPLRFRFRELVVPLFSQIATLGLQVQKLRRTCDLLLPRLLTGQVELTSND